MQRIKQYFESKQSDLSLVLMSLLMLCITLGPSAKSIAIVLASISIIYSNQIRDNFQKIVAEPVFWIIMAMFFLSVIGCLWSHASAHQKFAVIEKYSKLLFIPLFASGFIHEKTRHYGIQAYLFGIFITFCTYLYMYWFHNPDPTSGSMSMSGYVFYNHIVTGYMMALAVYLAAAMAIRSAKKSHKLGYILLVYLFSLQMLTINASRTGYILYAGLFVLFCIQNFSLKSVRYMIIGFAITISVLFQFTHSNTLTNRLSLIGQNLQAYESGDKNTSVGIRLQFHTYAKSLFLAKPILGQGTGGFAYHFVQDNPIPEWGTENANPHSQYWHTASEFGILGILLLLLILGYLLKLSFALQDMKFILQAVVLSFALACFSDTMLLITGVGYLFVTFAGLCLGEVIALRRTSTIDVTQAAFTNESVA